MDDFKRCYRIDAILTQADPARSFYESFRESHWSAQISVISGKVFRVLCGFNFGNYQFSAWECRWRKTKCLCYNDPCLTTRVALSSRG